MPTSDRRSRRHHLATPVAMISTVVLAILVASCSAASAPGTGQDLAGRPEPGAAAPSAASGGDGEQNGSAAERKIIKTGEITVEVSSVPAAVGRVRALALELGGYVGGSQSGTADEGATLTLRIPADRFDDALTRLHQLDGHVLSEATREEDVTSAVVDLEARLKNLQASEVQYRALLAKAVKIEDILAVQTRLDDVRGQIEQLQAQDKELTGLANLSTVTVTLVPGAVQQATGKWDPGKTITDAYASLVGVLQGVANGAIWFAIVWLPVLVVLGILVLLAMRFRRGIGGMLGRQPKE